MSRRENQRDEELISQSAKRFQAKQIVELVPCGVLTQNFPPVNDPPPPPLCETCTTIVDNFDTFLVYLSPPPPSHPTLWRLFGSFHPVQRDEKPAAVSLKGGGGMNTAILSQVLHLATRWQPIMTRQMSFFAAFPPVTEAESLPLRESSVRALEGPCVFFLPSEWKHRAEQVPM